MQLEDGVWKEMARALEEAKLSRRGSPGKMRDREFIEALLYLQRTGQPWRDLPEEMGYWHAIYMRFRRWEASEVWERLWKILQSPDFEGARQLFMDSTTIRAHQHAAGAKKSGLDQALGRSRGGLSTKIHAAAVNENSPVALHLTEGQANDGRQLKLSINLFLPTMC